jgi:hypothetical protein
MSDTIHNPAHYTAYPVQPIEISRHLGFCLGNAVKYVLRAPYKGGVEDINKALKYLDWERERPQAAITHAAFRLAQANMSRLAEYLRNEPAQPWLENVMYIQSIWLSALCGHLDECSGELLDYLGVVADDLANAIEAQRCRICGCTDNHACPEGCYWVEEDLCSACAEKLKAGKNQDA